MPKYLSTAQDKKGKWFVRLQNVNGEPYMKTETYDNKSNANRSKNDFEIIARRFLESKGYTVTHPTDEFVDVDTTE